MSKYCLVYDGKCHDYRYKKLQGDFHYAFYCGEIYMGQLFKMTCRSRVTWSAVPRVPSRFAPYDGFATRMDAVEMMLKVNGYRYDHVGPGQERLAINVAEEAAEIIEEYGRCASKTGIANFSVLAKKLESWRADK
jgi:hypothetical protein